MKRFGFTLALTGAVLFACCTAQAQLEDLWKKAQTSTQSTNLPGMSLSSDTIASGLKQALTKSTGAACCLHRTAQRIFREPGHQDPTAQFATDRRQRDADDGHERAGR